jgi:hypothetical protein
VPDNVRHDHDNDSIISWESATEPILTSSETTRSLNDHQPTISLSVEFVAISALIIPKLPAIPLSVPSSDTTSRCRAYGKTGNKRQESKSATSSPALPRGTSSSILPLMLTSTPNMPHMPAETRALHLASKSNYENILKGTHLPGISYPEALAKSLSSKLTSHKIAERDRRSRVNTALKEMQALLPQQSMANGKQESSASTGRDEPHKAISEPGTSKARIVEMATVYIKGLQDKIRATQQKLQVAEKKAAA